MNKNWRKYLKRVCGHWYATVGLPAKFKDKYYLSGYSQGYEESEKETGLCNEQI